MFTFIVRVQRVCCVCVLRLPAGDAWRVAWRAWPVTYGWRMTWSRAINGCKKYFGCKDDASPWMVVSLMEVEGTPLGMVTNVFGWKGTQTHLGVQTICCVGEWGRRRRFFSLPGWSLHKRKITLMKKISNQKPPLLIGKKFIDTPSPSDLGFNLC